MVNRSTSHCGSGSEGRRPILVLTATIHCTHTPYVERSDPAVREADYRWALEFWLKIPHFHHLVFCENSGASLEDLKRFAAAHNPHRHQLTFISCQRNADAPSRGKGFGEIETLREVLDHFRELPDNSLIVKVTGRYRALNAASLLRNLNDPIAAVFCNLYFAMQLADSRLFAFTPAFARDHFFPLQDFVDDTKNYFFEKALANAVHSLLLADGTWAPLPTDPLIQGVTGTGGNTFGHSPAKLLKQLLRSRLYAKLNS